MTGSSPKKRVPARAKNASSSASAPGERKARGSKSTPSVMKRLQSPGSQHRFSMQMREQGCKIGFVPTMGALHAGHLALVRKARSQNGVVVVSIFVNPLQFGPGEDYGRYPRDLARDMDRAREAGVDAVFVPEVADLYPEGFTTRVGVGPMAERLCGAERPGHFDGVCTVVLKLLGIVQPHRLYLGQKDAQQLIILERMLADLNVGVKVVGCPTVREKDGLALSSRNRYLTEQQRREAPHLYAALRMAQREILLGNERDPNRLRARMHDAIIRDTGFEIEYIALVDPESLEERRVLEGRTLIAIAARLGVGRLIDNILINVPGGRMAEEIRLPGGKA